MKTIVKRIIIFKFRILAWAYLKKNNIEVIAITGSAGKTTVKVALSQLINNDKTYIPTSGYNTDIGLPLAVFREDVPENVFSFTAWIKIVAKMILKLLKKSPYNRIVLEMGADHPGDIKKLVKIAKPHIAVITTVLPVHTENFKDLAEIANEKSQILSLLNEKDFAVLNYDDKNIREMSKNTKAQLIWVGENLGADLRAENINFSLSGLSFDLIWKGEKQTVDMKIIAPQLLISLLSAIAIGLVLGEDYNNLCHKIENFEQQNGRMKLLPGINDTYILDDSYNANPSSTIAALKTLAELEGRKIAVLGSMNELGDLEKTGHQEVGRVAAGVCDILITVGDKAEDYIVPEFLKHNDAERVKSFLTSIEAGNYLKEIIKKGDIILIKGSQNQIYVEETVKLIMKEPKKANLLLVRQTPFWKKKKEDYFKLKETK